LSSHPSRLSVGLTDPPVLWEYRTLSGVKRPEYGTDHSPASSESREEKCVDLRLNVTDTSPLRGLSKKLCIFTFTSCALDVVWCCHIPNCICDLRRRVVRNTRVGTLIVATIYLQLIQKRYMFRSFTVLHCSHQHCVQPVAGDVEVVGYL